MIERVTVQRGRKLDTLHVFETVGGIEREAGMLQVEAGSGEGIAFRLVGLDGPAGILRGDPAVPAEQCWEYRR